MGRPEGTHLPRDNRCVADILPEAACLGGCDGSWTRGEGFCEWPFAGSGDGSGFRSPEGEATGLLRATEAQYLEIHQRTERATSGAAAPICGAFQDVDANRPSCSKLFHRTS